MKYGLTAIRQWKSEQYDEKLHEAWRQIYAEWFPVASYEHADCDFHISFKN